MPLLSNLKTKIHKKGKNYTVQQNISSNLYIDDYNTLFINISSNLYIDDYNTLFINISSNLYIDDYDTLFIWLISLGFDLETTKFYCTTTNSIHSQMAL
jgi:hypothetical protein